MGRKEAKMEEKDKSKGSSEERWKGAIANLTEMASNLDSLQKLLVKKAVFVDEETFAKASLSSEQARTIKVYDLLHFLSHFHYRNFPIFCTLFYFVVWFIN